MILEGPRGRKRACPRLASRWKCSLAPATRHDVCATVRRRGRAGQPGGEDAALRLEQPELAPQAAAVAAQAAAGRDHAVTRDDDGDAVGAVGAADGAGRAGHAELARELGVGARLPVGDTQQRLPHSLLERAAGVGQRQVERLPAPGEVLVQLGAQAVEQRTAARRERAGEAPAHGVELGLEHAPVRVLEQDDRLVRGAGDQGADRRLQPGEPDEGAVGRRRRCAGRRPRQLAERRPEAGVRLPAVLEHDLVDGVARAQRDERVAQAAGTAVGLERHAVRLLEPAAHGGRIQAFGAQVGVADARPRVGLHASDQPRRPLGRAGLRVERPAPLARPEPRHERLSRGGVELDVLRLGVAGGARRAAEHARRRHASVEQAVVGPVPLAERREHLLAGRQGTAASPCGRRGRRHRPHLPCATKSNILRTSSSVHQLPGPRRGVIRCPHGPRLVPAQGALATDFWTPNPRQSAGPPSAARTTRSAMISGPAMRMDASPARAP